jgi:hypothetical protein
MGIERPLDGCSHNTLPSRSEFVSLVCLTNKMTSQLAEMVIELRTIIRFRFLVQRSETDRLLVGVPESFQNLYPYFAADQ